MYIVDNNVTRKLEQARVACAAGSKMLFAILLLYAIDAVTLTCFFVQTGVTAEFALAWWLYSYAKTALAVLTAFFLRAYLNEFASTPEAFSSRQTVFLYGGSACLIALTLFESALSLSSIFHGISSYEAIPPFLFSELEVPGVISLKKIVLAIFVSCAAFILRYVAALKSDSDTLA